MRLLLFPPAVAVALASGGLTLSGSAVPVIVAAPSGGLVVSGSATPGGSAAVASASGGLVLSGSATPGGVVAVPFDQDLQAYLASTLGASVYPGDHVSQGMGLPAFSYLCVGEDPCYTLRAAAGLTRKTYQFDSWSTSHGVACSMELQLRNALHGFRGMMGGTYVSSCRLQNCLDMPYEPNIDGSDGGTYHRVSEYRIAYREPVPTFP
jgi:hypothetical protein